MGMIPDSYMHTCDRTVYEKCFRYMWHAPHLMDEHLYFLQFKAAAITSIIVKNRELNVYISNCIRYLGNIYEVSLCKPDGFEVKWSMMNEQVLENAGEFWFTLEEYDLVWQIEDFCNTQWRRNMWVHSTIHCNKDDSYEAIL